MKYTWRWPHLKSVYVAVLANLIVVSAVAGKNLPTFDLKSSNGTVAKLTYADGAAQFEFDSVSQSPKAILIHFFQPDCNACLAEMRALETVHQDYAGDDVLVLGIAHRGNSDAIISAGNKTGVSYPLLVGTGTAIANKFARGDATIIFDSNGTAQFSQLGFEDDDIQVWRENLDQLVRGDDLRVRTIERARLNVGDVLPAIRLPELMTGDTMSLSIENGALCFTDADGTKQYPEAAVGMFSRY